MGKDIASKAPHAQLTRQPRPAKAAPQRFSQAESQSALANPHAASPVQILQLQQRYGNQAVQRLIQRAQTVVQPEGSITADRPRNPTQQPGPVLQRQTTGVIQRENEFLKDEKYSEISVDMFSPAMDDSGAFVGKKMRGDYKRARKELMGGNWLTRMFKSSPAEVDIRLQLLTPKIKQAYNAGGQSLKNGQTLGIFIAPEWYFKRPNQPFTEADKDYIIQKLKAISGKYHNLLIIPGSIVWRGTNAKGKYMLKNTVPIIANGELLRTHDKYMEGGDTQSYHPKAAKEYARGRDEEGEEPDSHFFKIGNVKFALEICGDHSSRARARQEFVDNPPQNFDSGVDVHLLVSHSALLSPGRTLVREGGYALQSDSAPHGAQAGSLKKGERARSMGQSKIAQGEGELKEGRGEGARDYYNLTENDLRFLDTDLNDTHLGEYPL